MNRHAPLEAPRRKGGSGGGHKTRLRVSCGDVQELMPLCLTLPRRANAQELTLTAELADENGTVVNDWSLWAFPEELCSDSTWRLYFRGLVAEVLRLGKRAAGRWKDLRL